MTAPTLPMVVTAAQGEVPVGGRPFIRWAGGKSRMLRHLLPYIPNRFMNYHEPFLGGGAMFFAIRSRMAGKAHLSDLNGDLINAWRVVQHRPNELLDALLPHLKGDSREYYYSVRSQVPVGDVERAAWFFYVNQTSWNSLYRVNRHGVFNVPWGDRPFRGLDAELTVEVSRMLTATHIAELDFRDSLRMVEPGDFVYLDPPYLPVNDTSKFFFYTQQRWRRPDLLALAEACEALTARGVGWLLSNRDTPEVRELFGHARQVAVTTQRSVAAQNRRDVQPRRSPELIIVGGPSGMRTS